jgi:hypothetical protein
VDTCTIAALDAITAFAVPNPNGPSQSSWIFRVWWLDELPRQAGHPAYFRLANITQTNPFGRRQEQHRTAADESQCRLPVQRSCAIPKWEPGVVTDFSFPMGESDCSVSLSVKWSSDDGISLPILRQAEG